MLKLATQAIQLGSVQGGAAQVRPSALNTNPLSHWVQIIVPVAEEHSVQFTIAELQGWQVLLTSI